MPKNTAHCTNNFAELLKIQSELAYLIKRAYEKIILTVQLCM